MKTLAEIALQEFLEDCATDYATLKQKMPEDDFKREMEDILKTLHELREENPQKISTGIAAVVMMMKDDNEEMQGESEQDLEAYDMFIRAAVGYAAVNGLYRKAEKGGS